MYELIRERLSLNNPIMAAAGTFGYGTELGDRFSVQEVGGIICKGVTLEPRAGNPPPRVVETAAGMLNAIGLANIGVEAIVREKAPRWMRLGTPVLVNVNGETTAEYVAVAERLRDVPGIAGLELNISCPNVLRGGMLFGADPLMAREVTRAVKEVNPTPLLVKLTPNAVDLPAIAMGVVEAGADAVSLVNTYVGMAIDSRTRRPTLTSITGGLSGPAIKPLALRLVYEVAMHVDVPLIGIGGIMNGEDALEYLLAGATAVQVGTANLVDPFSIPRIASELRQLLEREGVRDAHEVVGTANPARGRVR